MAAAGFASCVNSTLAVAAPRDPEGAPGRVSQAVARYAVAHSPYYERVFREHRSDPEVFALPAFQELPLLTKAIIRASTDEILRANLPIARSERTRRAARPAWRSPPISIATGRDPHRGRLAFGSMGRAASTA